MLCRKVVRELVKPPNQAVLDAGQLAEQLPRVLTMGGAVSPPAAVRFSIREHVWQREPPVTQVRGGSPAQPVRQSLYKADLRCALCACVAHIVLP